MRHDDTENVYTEGRNGRLPINVKSVGMSQLFSGIKQSAYCTFELDQVA